ncbi:MAG: 30S ribosomal protein S4e [Thermoplasmata archaeon]|nr:MAG: 30S ribosomal protein S4e [Thermoplasmata archaeon]
MSGHMKRLAAPRKWAIPRKTERWVVKSSPGPHKLTESLPLILVVRDRLKLCDTAKEARYIIGQHEIMVDGKVVTNYKHPVGFMDVISIPKQKEHYRVLLDTRGKIQLIPITKEESKWKLSRIENKTTVKGGKTQLNLHDGRNILLPKNKYKVCDVLKIDLEKQKILGAYSFEKGNLAMFIGGKHIGRLAAITDMKVTRSPMPNMVSFESFSTSQEYVFVVGKDTAEITIPEESML